MSAAGGPVPARVVQAEVEPTPESVVAPAPPELTWRALGVGCAIGAVLTVTNVYMGLKTSWWESGCIFQNVFER